jgi:HSP20 family protein
MAQQWNPLGDLMGLQNQMNRLFEDVTQRRARGETKSQDDFERADWVPAADVYEQAHAYIVALDLPGADRATLEISFDNDRLAVRGTRAVETETLQRAERPRGRFVRTFGVPASVDHERIEAEYKDGVLFISLPKRAEQKSQRVQIKVS